MEFQNQEEVNLMVWSPNPKLRNNSIISFYENKSVKVEVGDSIIGQISELKQQKSTYTIDEIIERRDGAMSGKNYVTAKVNWQFKPF